MAAVLAGTFAAHQFIEYVPPAERSEVYLPKPELAKIAALGFDAVVADYYWIQAMYAVGSARRDPTRFAPYIGKIIDVVTTLDPWVSHPYRFAAIWMTNSEESVRKANELLGRAIEYHPDDWRNYFYLGFNQFFLLDEHELAAESLEKAIAREGSPRYLPRLVARLRSETADIEAAEVFLLEMIQNAPDEEAVATYQGALDEISVERKARYLDRARRAFETLHGRDIDGVEELLRGEHPILAELPLPLPDEMPESLRGDEKWTVDSKTGLITSSYYGHRYKMNVNKFSRDEVWMNQWSDEPDGDGSEGSI
jgi:tetratricopeptide (TPR) repeat protein